MANSILIVDDEFNIRNFLKMNFQQRNFLTYVAQSAEEAEKVLQEHAIDIVISDYKLPKKNGLQLIREITEFYPKIYSVMITAFGDIDTAVKAVKSGAYDFLSKPFELKEINKIVDEIFEIISALKQRDLQKALKSKTMLIGSSEQINEIKLTISKIAESSATVLIQGETGTGKEVVARLIHEQSSRAEKAFVAVNCTTLSETLLHSELFGHEKGAFTDALNQKLGLFEIADGGTLFLDEIGDMPLNLQAKLLRVLQDKVIRRLGSVQDIAVDVRIITATNKQLSDLIQKSLFREDLFYRINIFTIELPALRNRNGDIEELIHHFMEQLSFELKRTCPKLSKKAIEKCKAYHWPGNVRELRNICERVLIISHKSIIDEQDLTIEISKSPSERPHLEAFKIAKEREIKQFESNYLQSQLKICKGNVSKAAELSQMNRTVFQRLLKKYKLKSNDFK